MKRILKGLSIILALCIILFIFGKIGWYENHYFQTGVVTYIDNNLITITDDKGEMWDIEDEQLKINDTVEITFFNGYTDLNRYDDEIISVKKIS